MIRQQVLGVSGRPTGVIGAIVVVVLVGQFGCQKKPAAPAPPARRAPSAVPFDHSMLHSMLHSTLPSEAPTRVRADCAPEALVSVVHRIGELRSGAQVPLQRSVKPRHAKVAPSGCPTPEAALAATETRGLLADRIASCVGQDGPYDAEWDMVNSALTSLAVCLDCGGRPKDGRVADCNRVADVLKRAEQAVHERSGH